MRTSTKEPSKGISPPEKSSAGRQLIVVMKPEVGLRATIQDVSSIGRADISALNKLLASENITMKPLFGDAVQLQADSVSLASATIEIVPDLSIPNLSKYHTVEAPDEHLERLADSFRQIEGVEAAYVTPRAELAYFQSKEMASHDEDAPPVTPDFTARQGYLGPAPGGVDAQYAWTIPGGKGQGVKIIDIEGTWNFTHEDLAHNKGGLAGGIKYNDLESRNHATAVVGEVVGDHNGFGISGISPDANIRVVSDGGFSDAYQAAPAIYSAANMLDAGDIILIELHYAGPRSFFKPQADQAGYIAIEWWPQNFDAIRYAVSKGVIVVEAAGNGGENLDDPLYDTPPEGFPSGWKNPFNPANPSSGAIIVGAGNPPAGTHGKHNSDYGEPYVDRARCSFSNYGSRIDVQGWGWEVTSTGYKDLQGGLDENRWYTDAFGGTSGASPIIVGTLGCVQGVLRDRGKIPLSPARARELLRVTGSPQQDGPGFNWQPRTRDDQYSPLRPATQRIGNRPNLRELISRSLET